MAHSVKWEDVEDFVAEFTYKNYWKFRTLMEKEDVKASAQELFLKCDLRYGDKVSNNLHFIGLFRSMLCNWGVDQSRIARRRIDHEVQVGISPSLEIIHEAGGTGSQIEAKNFGEVDIDMAAAPSEVREVIDLVLNSPKEVMETMLQEWKSLGRTKVFGNTFLCHFLNKDPRKVDLVGKVQSFLSD